MVVHVLLPVLTAEFLGPVLILMAINQLVCQIMDVGQGPVVMLLRVLVHGVGVTPNLHTTLNPHIIPKVHTLLVQTT